MREFSGLGNPYLNKLKRLRRNALQPCPQCGLVPKPGDKRCEFCGRKLATGSETSSAAAADQKRAPAGLASGRPALRIAAEVLKAVGFGGLVLGVFIYGGARIGERGPATQPPREPDGKSLAFAACEAHIRQQVSLPLSVKAFSSALVAEERGGYAVSGTVELQSAAGVLLRKRFTCKVLADEKTGMVIEAGAVH